MEERRKTEERRQLQQKIQKEMKEANLKMKRKFKKLMTFNVDNQLDQIETGINVLEKLH